MSPDPHAASRADQIDKNAIAHTARPTQLSESSRQKSKNGWNGLYANMMAK
jgi:hypothetical protein